MIERTPIDIDLALKQHGAYVAALAELGARIEWLPPLPDNPDAVFVEDTALFVSDLAIMARPGAPLRRDELGSVAQVLSSHRRIRWIEAPACLDGGDILPIGNTVFVGMSARTNAEAITALRDIIGRSDCVVVHPARYSHRQLRLDRSDRIPAPANHRDRRQRGRSGQHAHCRRLHSRERLRSSHRGEAPRGRREYASAR
ncbi:MAG: arginine deiminase family protein, partial [Steroidobacteraceae bacterium]